MHLPPHVTIVEVGPRDGLQNEAQQIDTAQKVAFVDALSTAGLPVIEVAAFVSEQRVPQMADAPEVFEGIRRAPSTRYTALVPNMAGLDRACAAGLEEVAIFASASETFSRRNINQGIDDSLTAYREVCARARELGMKVRAYLSTSFGCPFEGDVAPTRVAHLAKELLDMGAFEVAVSDTIGIAHPGQVRAVLDAMSKRVAVRQLALHFHDTRGMALANVLVGLDAGVTTFDASAGGLGGCPFAPGATGNLATEDLVYMLNGLGIDTGVNLEALLLASRLVEPLVGHPLPSRYYRAAEAASSR